MKFIKIYFSRTTWPISTKLGTLHPWMKVIQIFFKWRATPFPRGDNYKIAKVHWRNFKFFSRTTGPISTKIGTKHPWVKGIQVCSNEEPFNSSQIDSVFFHLLVNVMIQSIWTVFSGEQCGFFPNFYISFRLVIHVCDKLNILD